MSNIEKLLDLPRHEKIRRFDEMVRVTFSHLNGRDLLEELHPRRMLDIKRRVDGVETWFEADWLTNLMEARDGNRNSNMLTQDYKRDSGIGAVMGEIAQTLKSGQMNESTDEKSK